MSGSKGIVSRRTLSGPAAGKISGARCTERGLAAVEFVVMFPVLFLFVLGIVEFGRYYNATITVTHAAREAVRTVALCPSGVCSPAAAASTAANPITGGVTVSGIVNCPASGVGNASVSVNNTFSWDPLFSASIPGLPGTIKRTAVMRCGG